MLLKSKLANNTKHGAIFGMESRVLKKQFSELFLTRMQSVGSKETHEACRHTKHGAIFGMDARIALVVFSILGLAGAFFTKDIIAETQTKTFLEQMQNLRTAVRQNIADNGYDYTMYGSTRLFWNNFGLRHRYGSNALPEGRNSNPYISMLNIDGRVKLPWNVVAVDMRNLYASPTIDPANDNNNVKTDCVNTAVNCYYFIRILYADGQTFKLLEEEFDGPTTGLDDTNARTTGIIVASSDGFRIFMRVGRR